jgi:hypothetical protein
MRCQARRGRRRGGVLSQAQIPGPLQRSPSGRGAGNEGDGVGCLFTGYPDRKDVPQRHTDKALTPSRTYQTAGRIKRRGWRRIANDPTSSPGRGSRSEWCTIRREPPGPPARLWQTFPREDSVKAGPAPGHPWNASSKDRRRLARETHAAGKNAERGAGRSHITYLDRLLLAPRPIPRVKPEDKFQTTRRELIPTGGEAWGF